MTLAISSVALVEVDLVLPEGDDVSSSLSKNLDSSLTSVSMVPVIFSAG